MELIILAGALVAAFLAGLVIGRQHKPDPVLSLVQSDHLVVGPNGTGIQLEGDSWDYAYVVTPPDSAPIFVQDADAALAAFRKNSHAA